MSHEDHFDFESFTDWLFPGDNPPLIRNPSKIPKEAKEILKQVECATGIPWTYLERTARLVLNGLAGLRCLWWLHGLSGSFKSIALDRETPEWLLDLSNNWMNRMFNSGHSVMITQIRFGAGTINYQYSNITGTGKHRIERLGKWLKKAGASPAHIKEFETRQLPYWEWKISTHPYDVLTMSFQRAWNQSCMAPGGVAERGPLTDMAAGSAILFYYRPGATEPCGRVVLRPCLNSDGFPMIIHGGSLYGSGPSDPVPKDVFDTIKNLASQFYFSIIIPDRQKLCPLGTGGRALTRDIYSDQDRAHCKQTENQYSTAYENLRNTQWPSPILDFGDISERAHEIAETVEDISTDKLREAAFAIAEAWASSDGLSVISIEGAISSVIEGHIPTMDDIRESGISASDSPENDAAVHQLIRMTKERLEEMLQERLASINSTAIIIIAPENKEDFGDIKWDLNNALDGVRGEIIEDIQITTNSFRLCIIDSLTEQGADVRVIGSVVDNSHLIYLVIVWPDDDLGRDHRDALRSMYRELDDKRNGWTYYEVPIPPGVVDWRNWEY